MPNLVAIVKRLVEVTAPQDLFFTKTLPTRNADVVLATPSTRILDSQIRVWLGEPAQMTPAPVPVTFPTPIPAGHSEWFTLTARTKKHDVR